jgi:hypothetical protein
MAQGGAPRPTNPNGAAGRLVAQAPSPKQKPRRRDGALVIKRACLKGVAGTAACPPPQRRAAELHRLPPQRVQPPRGPFAWRGWACRHEHPDQGRRLTSPIRAEPDKPAASTGGPAVGFEEGIRFAVTRVMRVPPFCGTDRPSSPRSSPWVTHVGHSAELLPLSPATSFTRSTIRRRTAGRRCINDFASRSPSSLATKSSI